MSKTREYAHIFKAYDIRGVVGESLTEASVCDIGRAIGSAAQARGEHTVVVGRDGRLSGPDMSTALQEGLMSTGCDVVDIGVVPTPLTYFATHHLEIGSAVSVTGSHNPPDYNGFKMMLAGVTLSGDEIQALRRRIDRDEFVLGNGSRRELPVIDAYIERVTGDIHLERPLKIVIDCGNGVAGAVAPQLYRQLGCEVTELYTEVDGRFPNHHPDPSQLENLEDLIRSVRTTDAEFGLAFDGDGDRLGVVSKDGSVIWPDRQMLLFSLDILSRHPGAEIIYDVKCSRTLPAAITEGGGKPTMWKTGHSFIKAKLKASDAALAGEMSGHIFFKERWYGFDDGIYAGARLCELLSRRSETPAEVFAALPDTVNTPELRLELPEGEHYQLIDDLTRAARFQRGQVTTIDGIRVDYSDGFGLARASNTTPMVIFRFEADDEAALEAIQNDFRVQLIAIRPDIDLPF